jgi:hypothetical protein
VKNLAALRQLAIITVVILLTIAIAAVGVLILAYSAANLLTWIGIMTLLVALTTIGLAEFMKR